MHEYRLKCFGFGRCPDLLQWLWFLEFLTDQLEPHEFVKVFFLWFDLLYTAKTDPRPFFFIRQFIKKKKRKKTTWHQTKWGGDYLTGKNNHNQNCLSIVISFETFFVTFEKISGGTKNYNVQLWLLRHYFAFNCFRRPFVSRRLKISHQGPTNVACTFVFSFLATPRYFFFYIRERGMVTYIQMYSALRSSYAELSSMNNQFAAQRTG